MEKLTPYLKTAVAIAVLLVAAGCSSASSAPFHMYSSPLLESEMEPPRTSTSGQPQQTSPGVQPRQVYVYQRWHTNGEASSIPRQPQQSAGARQGPPLDTVHPSDQPVLAGYGYTKHTGAGRTADDTGGEADASTVGVQRSAPPREFIGGDPATISAEFIHTTLAVNDIELGDEAKKSIPQLYRQCRSNGVAYHSDAPAIGDLVFFHNTYDANEDGRNNDWYTLVGIIENISADGTIEFLTHRGYGIETLYLNRNDIDRQQGPGGRTINSQLRAQSDDDPPFTQHLAGQLFAGFCNILGDRSTLILMDQWAPGMELE